MANTISNHFAITALQEGVIIQGSLRIDGTLSQNWNPNLSKCVPDWLNDATTRPRIYPVVRKGTAYMSASELVQTKWLYNDVVIEFGTDNKSTNCVDSNGNALFQVGTTTVSLGGTTYTVPCLTVIGNLASATNIDLDTIGYEGSVELLGKQQAFQCEVDVKIAQMTTQGFLGLVSPESAIISAKGDTVTLTASLYDESGDSPAAFYPRWFDAGSGSEFTAAKGKTTLTVAEADVTDNMVVRVDFYLDSAYENRVTTAFASIDDTQDPEYLYISYNNDDSDFSGQLKSGESVTISAWVATMADSTAINTDYTSFAVKLYDGQQNEITGGPEFAVASNKGTLTLTYDFVAEHGYKVNGIVTAS